VIEYRTRSGDVGAVSSGSFGSFSRELDSAVLQETEGA